MFLKCFSKAAPLMSHMRGIHLIKDWQNCPPLLHAFKNLRQFKQAPCRRSIVWRKNNDRKPRLLDCCEELRRDGCASFKLWIVPESPDSSPLQLVV
ncbi:hypothetical protein RchiOBHm_Chr1g0382151 [Rosa chinensis]|uniref:Uncharacterized protein n=1 Tax=Rosa chinensis TaxID=74649 RepID=A0A2P6SPA3_ROSCH|nr:hypothetical protein RchiOBHm_Chr1g0382151 [Rosa chinensis]